MTQRPDGAREFESLAAVGLSCVLFVALTLAMAFLCVVLVEIGSSEARLAMLGGGVVLGAVGASVACWSKLHKGARSLPDGMLVPTFTIGVLALLSGAGIVWPLVTGTAFRPIIVFF